MRRRLFASSVAGITTALFVSLCLCSSLLAQSPQLQTKSGRRFPTVIFTYVFWNATPASYTFAIDSTGAVSYRSAPESLENTGVPYTLLFQANDSTRRTIFNVARNLDFFGGEFSVTVGSPQISPVRTLTYRDLTFNNLITYSDSTNSEIQELTSIFEEISDTLEFGRTLTYLRQNDKPGLDAQLAIIQREAERHHLRELQAVAPALRSVASDNNIEEGTRARARKILSQIH